MLLPFLLSVFLFVAPQTRFTMPVTVTTPADCPVVLTGQITYIDKGSGVLRYSSDGALLARNISDKPILALIVKGEYNDGGGGISTVGTDEEDSFFVTDLIEPNATENISLSLGPMGVGSAEKQHPLPRTSPHATAHVTFVEFADGTYWGSLKDATDMLRSRVSAWQRLNDLQQIYRLRGE